MVSSSHSVATASFSTAASDHARWVASTLERARHFRAGRLRPSTAVRKPSTVNPSLTLSQPTDSALNFDAAPSASTSASATTPRRTSNASEASPITPLSPPKSPRTVAPQPPNTARRREALAHIKDEFSQFRFLAALEYCDGMLGISSSHFAVLLVAARCCLAVEAFDTARDLYQRASLSPDATPSEQREVSEESRCVATASTLATCFKRGDYTLALKCCLSLREIFEKSKVAELSYLWKIQESRVLFERKDYKDAHAIAKAVTSGAPKLADGWYWRAKNELQLGEVEAACKSVAQCSAILDTAASTPTGASKSVDINSERGQITRPRVVSLTEWAHCCQFRNGKSSLATANALSTECAAIKRSIAEVHMMLKLHPTLRSTPGSLRTPVPSFALPLSASASNEVIHLAQNSIRIIEGNQRLCGYFELVLAEAYASKADYSLAMQHADAALAHDPFLAPALIRRAWLRFETGNPLGAKDDLHRLETEAEEDAFFWGVTLAGEKSQWDQWRQDGLSQLRGLLDAGGSSSPTPGGEAAWKSRLFKRLPRGVKEPVGEPSTSTEEGARRLRVQTHYQVLNIHVNATPIEIRRAYRAQALRWHPDKWVKEKHSAVEIKTAAEQFKKVCLAYDVLGDPQKRLEYDCSVVSVL